jgi:hypothetical protein
MNADKSKDFYKINKKLNRRASAFIRGKIKSKQQGETDELQGIGQDRF